MTSEHLPEQWNNREFALNYLQTAESMVVGRQRSIDLLKSFYRYFLDSHRPNTILDLGCGDGILTRELMQVDDSISAVLIDGSEDMLEQARELIMDTSRVRFVHASFQELIAERIDLPAIDFTVSSLAIHHLTATEKSALFRYIYSVSNSGGYFLNIDTVRSSSERIENWHLELWREGVFSAELSPNYEKIFREMLDKYTSDVHYCNIDTLESQMKALTEAGFSEVDCFYKDGIFAIYGGIKND